MKRTPLKARRETVRRNEGRVQHNRLRPKESAPPTSAERAHLAAVAAMPCLVGKGCYGRVEVHHVHSDGLKRIARSHRRVVPLCGDAHHRTGSESVHMIGHGGFAAVHEIDLLAEADRLWNERNV